MATDFVFARHHPFNGVDASDVEWPGVAPWPEFANYTPAEAPFESTPGDPYEAGVLSLSGEANPFHAGARP